LDWNSIDSLATKFGINLSTSTLRLNVFPKSYVETIVDVLLQSGQKLSPTNYSHILAILKYTDKSSNTHTYRVGFAPAASGLDHHAAFERLEDESNVSRAFYKIQEACERCGVKEWPQPTWNALDIGASPGGWSWYLSQVVGTVYAVDPADLTISKPNIIHLKGQMLQVLPQLDGIPLNMIVCDMNVDPEIAVECIFSVVDRLTLGGRIIWTLKYPKRALANIEKRLTSDIAVFNSKIPSCDVIRTMHMVSNHHERTLVAVKVRPTEPKAESS
jgi:23S rRNA C2498 (ribose-2'-O)-methylase RlmM